MDTRDNTGVWGKFAASQASGLTVAGRTSVPGSGVGAVLGTVTSAETDAEGYATTWDTGAKPFVSNVNPRPNMAVANAAYVPLSGGSMMVYSHSSTHLVVDINGYFTN